VSSSNVESNAGTRHETATATAEDKRARPGQDQNRSDQNRGTQAPTATQPRSASGTVSLSTDTGNTRIADGVVAKIAGLAARDIPGVFSMGSGMARRVGQLKSLIPGSNEAAGQGVSVEVGEREAAIDLNIVTWYGQSIVEITEAVRRNVVGQVEGMTGLRVIEVNIQVDDIQVESTQDTPEQRVQ
jgi:uncharacterized alkaline shock family protein YloU